MTKKRDTVGCRSVNLFKDQLEWIDTRKEELGMKSFTEFVRWLIDKEKHTTEILEDMHKCIEVKLCCQPSSFCQHVYSSYLLLSQELPLLRQLL